VSEQRYPLEDALIPARALYAFLALHCERIELAGSARRHLAAGKNTDSKTVGDIEFVVIASESFWAASSLLIGHNPMLVDEQSRADAKDLRATWKIQEREVWGPRQRKLRMNDIPIEIYIAEPENFGYIFALRTGPSGANQWIMNNQHKLGIQCINGAVHKRGAAVSVPTEHDFFRALGLPYVEPHRRSEGEYGRVFAFGNVRGTEHANDTRPRTQMETRSETESPGDVPDRWEWLGVDVASPSEPRTRIVIVRGQRVEKQVVDPRPRPHIAVRYPCINGEERAWEYTPTMLANRYRLGKSLPREVAKNVLLGCII